jgi:hypothetical protein
VLAASSPYFLKYFTHSDKSVLDLKDEDAKAVEAMVKFFYTSRVEVTEDNVEELLSAADMLQVRKELHRLL